MNLRAFSLLLLLVMATTLPAWAGSRKDKPEREKEDKDKPKLSLVADPAFGFTPMTVTLTGHLTGVDLHDRNLCHAAVTWVRVDPGQTERDSFRVREDPACVHGDEEITVVDSYTKTFDLYRPGSYLIRLEIQGKDGTRILSAYTRVEVLRVQ